MMLRGMLQNGRGLAILVIVSALVVARGARAQGSDSTAADVLFEEGRTALAKGDVALACAKFDANTPNVLPQLSLKMS